MCPPEIYTQQRVGAFLDPNLSARAIPCQRTDPATGGALGPFLFQGEAMTRPERATSGDIDEEDAALDELERIVEVRRP